MSRSIFGVGTTITATIAVLGAMLLLPAGGGAADLQRVELNSEAATGTGSGNPIRSPRIVGGSDAAIGSYPWQVQITNFGHAHCGGSLIHPMIILTAAHCLVDESLQPFLGLEAFTGRTQAGTGGEQLSLSSSYLAAGYIPQTDDRDWGYLSLSSPSGRPPIKIAGADEGALWRAGRNTVVTGYGRISEGGALSPVLKALTVPVLNDSDCGATSSYGSRFHPAVMLCAGFMAGGEDSCQGDSGGPLQSAIDGGGYRLVGVVSWGVGCARPDMPGVYARIGEPAVSGTIASDVREIEQLEHFPAGNNPVPVVGTGAKPAGCTAAGSSAATDKAAADAAAAQASRAKKKAKRTARKLKKANRKAKKAKGRKKRPAKRTARKLKRASRKANRRLNKAKAASSAAGQAAAEAAVLAEAACN